MRTDELDRVHALIRRHGWNATAFQTLESGYSYFFAGDDACVAYVDTGRAWVAAGPPIAAPEAIGGAVRAFTEAARDARRRCCFFATEHRLQVAAGAALRHLHIGEQPVWNPRDWLDTLARHRSLREQLRRARAKGVRIRIARTDELQSEALREALHRVASRWLGARSLAPMGFLVHVELFHYAADRRCFLAEVDGRIVGFAGVVPVPARPGWFVEDLVRDPEAPNGTGELLVDAVMRWASDAGSPWLTLGLAPLAGEVGGVLRLARRGTALLYDFEGLRAFKAKLRPESWSAISLSYPPTQGPVVSVIDALAAFTRGGFTRFAVRSLLRGPRVLVQALAALLLVWTCLLAAAPAERWFCGAAPKWGWVAFDLAMTAGLLRLLRRPSAALAGALAVAATLDAVVTPIEAGWCNLPRLTGVVDAGVVALACAGPVLAAAVLWRIRGRLAAA